MSGPPTPPSDHTLKNQAWARYCIIIKFLIIPGNTMVKFSHFFVGGVGGRGSPHGLCSKFLDLFKLMALWGIQ